MGWVCEVGVEVDPQEVLVSKSSKPDSLRDKSGNQKDQHFFARNLELTFIASKINNQQKRDQHKHGKELGQ